MEIGSRISVEVPIRDSNSGTTGNAVRQILAYLTIGNKEDGDQKSPQNKRQALDQLLENGSNTKWTVPGSGENFKMGVDKSVSSLTAEEMFRFIMSDHRYLKMDSGSGGDSNNTVPNAAEIQKFFLDTIDRISFQPITDVESRLTSPYGSSPNKAERDNLETQGVTEDVNTIGLKDEEPIRTIQQTITRDEFEKRRKEKEIWTTECRAVLGKMQYNSLMKHALELLEECWKRYLTMSVQEVTEQVLEDPEGLNLTDDVIEMLEDRSRYVWQIIDEMPPRNLPLPF